MIALNSFLDTSIEQMLYEAQTPFGVRVFSLVTELGSGAAVVVVAVLACLLLWRNGYLRYAFGLLAAVGGAIAVSEIIKRLVERARPPLEWHAVVETGYSFPSNHATAAAALYGFLVYLAWKLAPEKWRGILVAFSALVILLVGFSRLYLGVHYPSDVVAGFILGGLFAFLGARAARKIQMPRSE